MHDSAGTTERIHDCVTQAIVRVLDLDSIAKDQRFVEVGGDSLDAVEVTTLLGEQLGVYLEPGEFLLQNPTTQQIAQWIDAQLPHARKTVAHSPADAAAGNASIGQARLWSIAQGTHGAAPVGLTDLTRRSHTGEYVVTFSVDVIGTLDVDALRRSLNSILARHEPLRSAYQQRDRQVLVHVLTPARWPLEIVHARGEGAGERRQQVERHIKNLEQQPFDLESGQLVRGRLLQFSADRSTLLIAVHHIAIDAWSVRLFLHELARFYKSATTNQTAELAALPARYADFVAAESAFVDSDEGARQLTWWVDQLAKTQPMALPASGTIPASTPDYQFLLSTMPADLTGRLRELSRREGCTPFMTLLAAFQILVARYCDKQDFVIATPMSCRSSREWEALIGFFVNTVALRATLEPGISFRALLRAVRQTVSNAFRRRSVPFDRIVARLHAEDASAASALTQIAFAFYEPFPAEQASNEVGFRDPQLRISTSRFPIEFHIWDDTEHFRIEAHFDSQCFAPALMEQLVADYTLLCQASVSDPDLPAWGHRLSSAAEISADGPDAASQSAPHAAERLELMFTRTAARHRHKIAIKGRRADMTYGELNERSEQLADELRRARVWAESCVAICLQDLSTFATAAIAVLKSGGCYVPVDPSWPSGRREQVIREANCAVVLNGEMADGREIIKVTAGPQTKQAGEAMDSAPRMRTLPASSAAYVMFTSGSSGTPKGVVISHQAVASLVRDARYARVAAGDTIAQASNRAFDASTFEIWSALLAGAALAEIHRDELLSAERLREVIAQRGVSKLFVTTTLFRELVQQDPAVFSKVETLLFGGERVAPQWVSAALAAGPPQRLVHVYGPTETTTFATWHEVGSAADADVVPIGRPLHDTQCYILDHAFHAVPKGIAGELYIGGIGLARGYQQDPCMTAERFVPDPFAMKSGARLFRTGDRVRLAMNGSLEFIERMDDQVKIRGFRVEPGEIEAMLGEHRCVRTAVVMPLPAPSGEPADQILAAWVETQHDGPANPAAIPTTSRVEQELRQMLQSRLPSWMVPTTICLMDVLPRSTNGKIDRHALRSAFDWSATRHGTYVAPTSSEEKGICSIYADLLQVERVGADDDFFRMGGHSLLATQVISRIRSLFGVSLPIEVVFRSPTPASLAAQVTRAREASASPRETELQRQPRYDGVFPASFAQQRLWFLDQLEPESAAYNVPLATRIRGPHDRGAMQRAVDLFVERHESLRTTFDTRDGEVVQIVHPRCDCPVEFIDLTEFKPATRESEVRRLAAELMERPFDLRRDCMLRIRIVRMDVEDHVWLVSMHHIASDGWSLGVLVSELPALYEAECRGQKLKLPELPIQYADFSLWQREHLRGPRLETLLNWWRRQLEGLPTLTLPADHPRPASFSGKGRYVARRLPQRLEDKIRTFGRNENATIFMTMLAAFQVLISRYTGCKDVAVGSPIANRNRSSLEGLIGFFVNTLVMRVDVGRAPSFRALVRQVRQMALAAYEHQDLPFEQLVEALRPVRDSSRNPLFEVTFAVQNAPLDTSSFKRAEPFDFEITSARFDLELDVRERSNGSMLYAFYREELFERATIERLLAHFEHLLEQFLEEPDRPISHAQILSHSEYQQLVVFPNQTPALPPPESCLHALFEHQARATPDAPAVTCGGISLSYAELDARADQLATRLLAFGVGLDEVVAFEATRSIDMVTSALGILKAGAACLPLDPQHPRKRLLHMMTQAGVRLCVGPEEGEPWPGVETLPVEHAASRPAVDSQRPVHAENAAFVLFTSGTTGAPNGVVLTHQALANFVASVSHRLRLTAEDRLLQFASPGFDVIIEELFPIWSVGGTVVIADSDHIAAPEQFADVIEETGVTCCELPVAYWRAWVDHLSASNSVLPHRLRLVLLGCEQPDVPRLQWWSQTAAELFTVFGLTETAVTSTMCRLPREETQERITTPLSLGSPIDNTQCYVLDESLNPVPPGVIGELHIGGMGLARGYVKEPRLTANRFVPNPFAMQPGGRMYRTGDLAKYRQDGTIEFVGRRDHQFNLRGFRIEAGEIEASLCQHPFVAEAAVGLDDQTDRLVAYVSCRRFLPEFRQIEDAARREHLFGWQEFYEQSYAEPASEEQWNLSGWVSTFTGRPISAEGMQEQVGQTVARMLRDAPRSVLEVGCGTGLLLHRVAPFCQRYVATDISSVALKVARKGLAHHATGKCDIRFLCQDAGDMTGIKGESFDLICLNSVVQHFPDVEYLAEVIERLSDHVAKGGRMLLGDVRLRPLASCFYSAVEVYQANYGDARNTVLDRVSQRHLHEPDLIVDPEFLNFLARRIPRIDEVRIEPKQGRDPNELCCFRFDVSLYFDSGSPNELHPAWNQWSAKRWSSAQIEQHLRVQQPAQLLLQGIPNGRLQEALRVEQELRQAGAGCIDPLRELLVAQFDSPSSRTNLSKTGFVDPMHLWELGERLGYKVDLRLSASSPFCLDVAFLRDDARLRVAFPDAGAHADDRATQANRPTQRSVERKVSRRLRKFLQGTLPEYMIPSIFVLLDRLPVSAHGKLNREALPRPKAPAQFHSDVESSLRSETESVLMRHWSEVLDQHITDAEASFFELGGHSLLAVQVVSRIRTEFALEVPLRTIFEYPTVRQFAEKLDDLRKSEAGAMTTTTIPQADRNEELALSFGQERLWFLNQLDPGSCAYNIMLPLRLCGPLRLAALRSSLAAIAQRHEVLRTVYPARQGRPMQQVEPVWQGTLRQEDVSHLPSNQLEDEIVRLAREEEQIPFDLTRGPVFRSRLVHCSDDDHVLLLAIHHIAADGWSMGLLARELAEFYEAFCMGRHAALRPLAIQCVDVAQWQRALRSDARYQDQLNYWVAELETLQPLNLPTDWRRPAKSGRHGHAVSLRMDKSRLRRVVAAGEQQGATPFMTHLAAFFVLLKRLTGENDLAVGCPVANRNYEELESLIGFFVNSLVIRCDTSDDPSFERLLQRIRNKALAAYAHQELPFEKIVEQLQPDRSMAQNPLFQVMFAYEAKSDISFQLADLAIEMVDSPTSIARFDLEVHVLEDTEGANIVAVYDRTLFDTETVTAWLESYLTLLDALCSHPGDKISRASALSPTQWQTLRAANDPRDIDAVNETRCIHDAFARQSKRTPNNVAVLAGDHSLTYQELNERATRLAGLLHREGVKPEQRVALLVARSIDAVVAMLATLKAGGTYVPLDPQLPIRRLAALLNDADPVVILCEESTRGLAAKLGTAVPAIAVAEGQQFTGTTRLPNTNPGNLAYMLFTSGSTGDPKGVGVTHRNVIHHVVSSCSWLEPQEGDTWSLFHSFGFDFSVWELWGGLLSGGKVVIVPEDVRRSPDAFLEFLISERVTFLNLTPTAFRALAHTSDFIAQRDRRSVRVLVLSGETLDPGSLLTWFDACGETVPAVFNLYGITETTVFVAGQRLFRADIAHAMSGTPIGRSLPAWQCRLLDQDMNPVPPGAVGELYVGGPGLARGYCGDPRKTAECFVPDPWGRAGARLYRSGDLARLRPEGTLEYLGRLDDQVQLRGHRVEPHEVASRLCEHAGVRSAFVTSAKLPHNDLQLVAYVVPDRAPSVPPNGLRTELFTHLKERLPSWMLPGAIIFLDALPLSQHGKIDRQALPAPTRRATAADRLLLNPRDLVEQSLVEIWSNVLGYGPIAIDDDFFELGGHSLLAAQVVARIRDTLGVDVPVRLLFENPRIAELASSLRDLQTPRSQPCEPIEPARRDGFLPLSFAQQRLWFLSKLNPEDCAYNVPIGTRITGPVDHQALQRSLDYLIQRHEALRTKIVEQEGRPFQQIAPPVPCPLPTTDLKQLSGKAARKRFAAIVRMEEMTPFELIGSLLCRAQLVRLAEDDHVLVMTLHHIICDGWSISVLQEELATSYAAFRQGQTPDLDPLPLQFADFASWEQARSECHDDRPLVAWWRKTLSAVEPVSLPCRKTPDSKTVGNAESLHYGISSELTARLDQLSRHHSASQFMLLLGALYVVLVHETGQPDVTVGTPVANRHRTELERIVGFFVNLLVMRIRLDGNPAFADILAATRATALDAFAHQDVSFERLVEELRPDRAPQANPFFNILFSFQSFPFDADETSGNVTPLGLDINTSRFELELLAWDLPSAAQHGVARPADRAHRLQLTAVFRSDVYARSDMERLLATWENVLEMVADDPTRRLTDLLQALSGDERRTTLEVAAPNLDGEVSFEVAAPDVEVGEAIRLEAIVSRQADATPHKVAVRDCQRVLTYEQLDHFANRLATHLNRSGVKQETHVGLFVERSADAIAAMLGILKSGGVFVPLPPESPPARLEALVREASIKLVVATSASCAQLASLDVTCIDLAEAFATTEDGPLRPPTSHPDALAYVMFTSGSTGNSKCVGATHGSIRNLVVETDYVHFSPDDVVSQIADIAFDGSTFEIWGALLNGATLEIVERATAVEAQALRQWFEARQITVSFLPTSLFHQLARDDADMFQTLRYLIIGGERLDPAIVQRMLGSRPKRLVNGYGPTEATTFATSHAIVRLAENARSIAIGKPIFGVDCLVLDEQLQPVRPGQRGELYIAGSGLGRGYVNDPALTAARYVPHPFSDEPGARVYRTGDLVVLQPSGILDFLGRSDDQIKVRGHRVELGEIELMVQSYPHVNQAVVLAREDGERGTGLTCYFVKDDETGEDSQAAEYVDNWRSLYEDLYAQTHSAWSPSLNLIGWNSSYTGDPIAPAAMEEQVSQTVHRIERLAPKHVLEIGCGTGLLLFRLADQCMRYVATDFSPVAVGHIRRHLSELLRHPDRVELLERDACDFDGFAPEEFDTVILNSVVQYFPSVDYLVGVLRGVSSLIRPGGKIFLGDIRSLSLLRTLHTDVALYQADDGSSCSQLREQIDERCRKEDELLLEPGFFLTRLPLPISDVRIELKEGRQPNELTRYRYDVVLTVAENDADSRQRRTPVARWLTPGEFEQDPIQAIDRILAERHTEAIGIQGVLNARIHLARLLEQLQSDAGGDETAGTLKQAAADRLRDASLVDPQDLWDLGRQHGYDVEVRPSLTDAGCLDAAFVCSDLHDFAPAHRSLFVPADTFRSTDPRRLANDPLSPVVARETGEQLTAYLSDRLPEYMIPAQYVLLDRFPLNASGKVDRRALPAPPSTNTAAVEKYVEPQTRTESLVAAIWADLLRLDRVGKCDNFFRLGGHSLLATQVVTRIRKAFGIDLPLRVLFEKQTVAEIAVQIDQLVAAGSAESETPIQPAPRDVAIPLSYAQQRLWFLEQLEPNRCSYNMAAALRLQGPLKADALRHSLDMIVQRHEALRTCFPAEGGRPVQRITPAMTCPLSHVDLSELPADQCDREVARYAKQEETTPFDLEAGPVIRGRLLRCADDDWVLLLTMHHIVSDGWSITILTRELAEFYGAYLAGRPVTLPPLPVQYADFACWQREEVAGKAMRRQLDYWRNKLIGVQPLRLPLDRPAASKRSFQGAIAVRRLPRSLSERVDQLSRQENVTSFMTLLAAFQVLLARWTGQSDIAVGTPIANRNRGDIEGLIGFFVNSLVMRTNLHDDPSFLHLLARTRETALEAFAHQDLPFEKLVEELRPERNLTQNPLFRVMFAVQNATSLEFSLPDLTMSVLEFDLTTTRFDLEIHAWEEDDGLTVRAFYDTELFDEDTIRRLLVHYEHLLISIVTRPGDAVSELPLLPAVEEALLLHEWNQVATAAAPQECLHHLFAEHARKHPDRVAVVDEAKELSYQELDRRANALAGQLRDGGVVAESLVPICCDRGAEAVVAMLGILKAGGAYVPLDPQWPRDRLQRMISETLGQILVADKRLDLDLPPDITQIVLDCADPLADSSVVEIPACPSSPDQLAYVIYTSGSSGQPKGVQITHGNVARLFQQANRHFVFQRDDVWSVFHAFSFDFSVWEIWGALLSGATLVVVPELPRRSPDDFVAFLAQHEITILSQTPTAFSQLLSVEGLEDAASTLSLRYVVFGGESLDAQLLRRWFQICGDDSPQVVNMYGITETTVHVTFERMRWEHVHERAGGSLIGRRLNDLQLYLLDDTLKPVPQGSIGEIYVGGAGLARGYLNAPALSAERFIPHPWGPPGARLYRTGDLARFRRPEVLEHWGRADNQIKLRGFRIEPAEIENCLRRHPKVLDAIVTLQHMPGGDQWLVAHVTKPAAVELDENELSGELQRYVRLTLPEPMLPRSYTLLREFPRTLNGKVDRAALPAATGTRPQLQDAYVACQTDSQRKLAGIWEEIMKLDRVGLHDSFFDLGGHSLLATQVVSRIRDRFGVALPLRTLFESPSISELAAWIDERVPADQEIADAAPMGRAGKRRAALQRLRQQRKPNA